MAGTEGAGKLTIEELPERREKTEALAQFFRKRLAAYIDVLRPLLVPAKLFGRYAGAKEDVVGAEKSIGQLRETFNQVCGKPFSLSRDLDDDVVLAVGARVELEPWEYSHTIATDKEKRVLTITSPVRWLLTYASGISLSQLRAMLSGKATRQESAVRQFVTSALVMKATIERFPGIAELLSDLRYSVRIEKSADFGDLPLVTLNASVPSFRPSDDLLLSATRLSGVPAFIELVDTDRIATLEDPLKSRIVEILK